MMSGAIISHANPAIRQMMTVGASLTTIKLNRQNMPFEMPSKANGASVSVKWPIKKSFSMLFCAAVFAAIYIKTTSKTIATMRSRCSNSLGRFTGIQRII